MAKAGGPSACFRLSILRKSPLGYGEIGSKEKIKAGYFQMGPCAWSASASAPGFHAVQYLGTPEGTRLVAGPARLRPGISEAPPPPRFN
jgi:hypothetical protein